MEVHPPVLEFHSPLKETSTKSLTLTNTSGSTLAFKVKTTAPKTYCVRPNSACVKPGEKIEIGITLQGLKAEPEPSFKCRDKFLLVTLPIADGQVIENISSVWKELESSTPKDRIVNTKVRVNYKIDPTLSNLSSIGEKAELSPVSPNGITSPLVSASPNSSPVTARNINSATTPTTTGSPIKVAPAKPVLTGNSPAPSKPLEKQPAPSPVEKAQIPKNTAPVAIPVHATGIENGTVTSVPSGVPLQIVALIAFISFLIGVLFF